jgi:glucokinase
VSELCIDFGGTAVKLGVLASGSLVAATQFEVGDGTDPLGRAEDAARTLLASAAASGAVAPTATGVAVPGVVDRRAGTLVRAHDKYVALAGVDVRAWAERAFGLPCDIENDARAALVGETAHGVAAGASDAVLMTIGTGIGTAAMMGGAVLRGATDHAGILGGHVTVDLAEGTCPCGNVGCAESVASTWALERVLHRHPGFPTSALAAVPGQLDLRALTDAAPTDTVARDTLEMFVRVWGAALVTLCHAYDPAVAIVSGGALGARDAIVPAMTAYLERHLWSSAHRPRVVVPERPDLSVLRGLAVVARAATDRRNAHGAR